MLYHLPWVTFSLYVVLDQPSKVFSLLKAIGFTWDTKGFEHFDLYWASIKAVLPTLDRDCETTAMRLMMFLVSPDSSIDHAEVNLWIPSPKELAKMERGNTWVRRYVLYDLTSTAARAFLKLGRDNDAYELASLAVAPEQNTEKKWTLVSCHSILGQIAAKRGKLNEADKHFANALEEARLSRLPMLEILAVRDRKRHISANFAGCETADAVIDAACLKMTKTRGQLASVIDAACLKVDHLATVHTRPEPVAILDAQKPPTSLLPVRPEGSARSNLFSRWFGKNRKIKPKEPRR